MADNNNVLKLKMLLHEYLTQIHILQQARQEEVVRGNSSPLDKVRMLRTISRMHDGVVSLVLELLSKLCAQSDSGLDSRTVARRGVRVVGRIKHLLKSTDSFREMQNDYMDIVSSMEERVNVMQFHSDVVHTLRRMSITPSLTPTPDDSVRRWW